MSGFHGLHLPAYTYWPYIVLKLMHALVISVIRCEVSLQTDFSSNFPHLAVTLLWYSECERKCQVLPPMLHQNFQSLLCPVTFDMGFVVDRCDGGGVV